MKNLIFYSSIAFVILFSSCDHLIDNSDDGYFSFSFVRYNISTGNKEVVLSNVAPSITLEYPTFYFVKNLNRIIFFCSDSSGYYDGKDNSFTEIYFSAYKTMISNTRKWILVQTGNEEYFILNTETLQINKLLVRANLMIWDSECKPSFSTLDDKIVFSIIDYDLNKVELAFIDLSSQNVSPVLDISNDSHTNPEILNPVFTSDDQKIFFAINNLLSTNKVFHQSPGLYSINIDGSNLLPVDTSKAYKIALTDGASLVRTPIKKIAAARASHQIFYTSERDYNYLYKADEDGQNIAYTGYYYGQGITDLSISSTGNMLLLKGYACYLNNLSSGNKNSISFNSVENIMFSQDEKSLEYTGIRVVLNKN